MKKVEWLPLILALSWVVSFIPLAFFGSNILGFTAMILFWAIGIICFLMIVRLCIKKPLKGILALIFFPPLVFFVSGFILAEKDYKQKQVLLSQQELTDVANLSPQFREYPKFEGRWPGLRTSLFQNITDRTYQYFVRRSIINRGFTAVHYTGIYPRPVEAENHLRKNGRVWALRRNANALVFSADSLNFELDLNRGLAFRELPTDTDSVLISRDIPDLLIVATQRYQANGRNFNRPQDAWYMNEIWLVDIRRKELFCIYRK